MTDLHPHWTATDSQSPAKPGNEENHIPVGKRNVSRMPAALVGMTLVILVGAGFLKGLTSLRAQLLNEINITITEDAVSPQTVTAAPGQEIAWTNTGDLPHLFSSSTLCTPAGVCLYSDILMEGDTKRYTIPVDVPAGEYQYASEVDPTIQGTIIVEGEPITDSPENEPADDINGQAPPDIAEEDIPELTPPEPEVATGTTTEVDAPAEIVTDQPDTTAGQIGLVPSADFEQIAQEKTGLPQNVDVPSDIATPSGVTPRAPGVIPRNPYTVGSPINAAVQPTHSGAPPAVIQHEPFRQPQTGATAWTIVIASIAGFAIVGRRMLQRVQVIAS